MLNRKFCPIMSNSVNHGKVECEKDCGWWDNYWDQCALVAVAKSLESVRELAEGHGTLLVREC